MPTKSMSELDTDLCDYCPLDDCLKGVHGTPNGYTACEGCRCNDAYENYLDQFEEDE